MDTSRLMQTMSGRENIMSAATAVRFSVGLRATLEAVQQLVTAIHDGRLSAGFVFSNTKMVYWSPSFVQGQGPTEENSKPFTALTLSLALGNATRHYRSHECVRTALLICELRELGELDEEDIEYLITTDALTQRMLIKVLTKTRTAHYADEAAQQLLATSQQ